MTEVGDVRWCEVNHHGGSQWIRVVIDYVYLADAIAAVKPLFPGDAQASVWTVKLARLREEQPLFDEIDATYDGDGDFEFA